MTTTTTLEFASAVREARAGTIPFDSFARRTMPKWRGIAHEYLRKWVLPNWVELEDVVQDLLLAAWESIGSYDPSRDTSSVAFEGLPRFVEWRARKATNRRMTRAMGLETHRNTGPAWFRFEVPESAILGRRSGDDSPIEDVAELAVVDPHATPEQERAIDDARDRAFKYSVLDQLAKNTKQRTCLHALYEEGSVDGAARAIYNDVGARLRCRVSTVEEARGAVHATVTALQRQYGLDEEPLTWRGECEEDFQEAV